MMKKNIPYIIIMIVAITIGTYKYSLKSTLLGFGMIIVLGLFFGLIIVAVKRFLK